MDASNKGGGGGGRWRREKRKLGSEGEFGGSEEERGGKDSEGRESEWAGGGKVDSSQFSLLCAHRRFKNA